MFRLFNFRCWSLKYSFFFLFLYSSSLYTAESQAFETKIASVLNEHYQQFHRLEYFSGAALSIGVADQPIHSYFVGSVSHYKESAHISKQTLFQIGSITKSFTAAIILSLEKEDKLHIADKLKMHLPQYLKWADVTIQSLLNMTSGLPNYSDTPDWNSTEQKNPAHHWTSNELIQTVYPPASFSPPLKRSYFYTNTAYILAGEIIEKVTKDNFQNVLNKMIATSQLTNTFYSKDTLDATVIRRLAHGYSYNQYDNPALLGIDTSRDNLSWAAAAGGIVSDTEDMIKWVRILFIEPTLLNDKERKHLTTLISLKNGKPILTTTKEENRGFGLGVSQSFDEKIGRYWLYEGETLGFRALYMYIPCNQVIIASAFNSATNPENDHAGLLMKKVYKLVLEQYPQLNCKS